MLTVMWLVSALTPRWNTDPKTGSQLHGAPMARTGQAAAPNWEGTDFTHLADSRAQLCTTCSQLYHTYIRETLRGPGHIWTRNLHMIKWIQSKSIPPKATSGKQKKEGPLHSRDPKRLGNRPKEVVSLSPMLWWMGIDMQGAKRAHWGWVSLDLLCFLSSFPRHLLLAPVKGRIKS